ncbi:RNA-directed DNA polymerase (Reverse transcriptase), Ribonuclease H-like protein [Gossypium australe]|uniref:RNA-directed DNA polymerase (Reverse transcriptase), Ribonuclease H-like protein n=1 Tax=Gossypium australe TaxID=47621 RepID=A0A5B6UWD4_9ROSI|nr:RNA-directed DNA polymerase (Reverse transcriptase), Ribonuclease H-like protein [Gossypium australe]
MPRDEIAEEMSSDINDMSDAATNSKSPFVRDMCLEETQDFEDDRDCNLFPDLLRMVEQEEKQILSHKESVEIVSLEEGKEVKIRACIVAVTKRDLIELLQKFKDVFAWSYQDMPGLSTDIVVHWLPIKEECKPVQQKLRRMRPIVLLKIKEEVKKDLNKASPKDSFPLLHIDTLVDNTVGYSLFSFMDGFLRYNQIKMYPENMDKTTFVTMWGTFCYKKEIEVYVDNMIAKSRTEEEHEQVLRKLFLRLRKFQLKLNPAKCTFGDRLRKLLGFAVSEKGIEINPEKVKVIQQLLLSRTQKEVRVLMPHNPDRPLILYLAVFGNSMGCVLSQHGESGRKEIVIYYLSKKFTECETRYSSIDKLCCAPIWTTRRLRQYMMYHTTWLISKLDPLKYMLELTALNGRMARWQILLYEFDIVNVNQKAVKGSTIADFLASRALEDYDPLNFDFPNEDLMYVATTEEDSQEDHLWKLNFDGASNVVGNRIGVVLVSPNGDHYPFTSKLDFDCTNNMVEYEACIMGIRATIEHEIKVQEVYENYALVIYQLKGEWETRDPNKQTRGCKPIQMSIYKTPAHCYNIEEEEEEDDHPWYHEILRYVKNHEYLDQATENDKMTLRKLANDYVLYEEILYKRRKDQWVEATSYANVTKSVVSKFLKKEIICRYGMPGRIISDNTLNLKNSMIAEVCSQFKIKHHNSSPYRLKMNGAVEAANKNIKRIMGKMTETYKDRHKKLPFALYAYRTSIRTSTGATPFSLLDEAEWIQSRFDQLNLIEKKRLKAIRHGQMYQKRMMRAYNKKVHSREFHEGDLVLKKILPIQKDFRGKWMPNWEGPYVIPAEQEGRVIRPCNGFCRSCYIENGVTDRWIEKGTNPIPPELQWDGLKMMQILYLWVTVGWMEEIINLISLKLQQSISKFSW